MKSKFFKLMLNTIGKILPPSHTSLVGFIGKKFRLYCAKRISNSIGDNVNIEQGAIFTSKLVIGNNSGIGKNCLIMPGVSIGNNVMMGPECLFYTNGHRFNKDKQRYDGHTDVNPITVEDDVWLGARCIILPGVTIGKGSTVGAGSIVTKNVPPYTVAAGNPAKVVKSLI